MTDSAEEAQERYNVERAKWVIDHCGKVLPVTNLFDTDSNESFDPILAVACVAYDADSKHPEGKWLCLGNLEPGDIWRKTDGEVPRQGRTGYH